MHTPTTSNSQTFCGFVFIVLCAIVLTVFAPNVRAGGGNVVEGDACIVMIDFYSLHLTAYQPETSGNEQFCQEIPDIGRTIIVLDYLHQSLKEVPVDFRIIRDVTGQGDFVKLKHVEEITDIEQHTVFYQPATIEVDASLQIEYDFEGKGRFIGIISAGHPGNDNIYYALVPFEVGRSGLPYVALAIISLAGTVYFARRKFFRTGTIAIKQGLTL